MTRPESASPRSPARWLSVLAAAGALGGCTAETEGLEVPDAALVVCAQPADCAGSLPVCEDPSRCGCGTFRTCVEGQCRVVAVDCVGDGGATDATAPDALAPGGPDAATLDGTAPGSCTTALDCQLPPQPTARFCENSAYSCVDRACLWECVGPRSCTVTPDDCLLCRERPTASCPGERCSFDAFVATVEDATDGCALYPGTALAWRGARVQVTATARLCSYSIWFETAPALPGVYRQLEDGTYLGQFLPFGGTCTGVQAPTGALRIIFSCPACQFVLGP